MILDPMDVSSMGFFLDTFDILAYNNNYWGA